MKSWRAFLETVNIIALALWLGAVGMAAAFAARVFPLMHTLSPTLKDFDKYSGDHWRLAAGKIANEMFFIADVIQFAAALAAGFSLAFLITKRWISPARISTWIRGLGIAVAMSGVMGMMLFVTPPMNAELQQYWNAALIGDAAAAQLHQEAFSEFHPLASGLMATTFLAVLCALAASAWSLGIIAGSTQTTDTLNIKTSKYPTPLLARNR